ncbi:hypothetical protein F5I97DRAFT_1937698 [Phlebopus sp. FC_14]|nr:hypothetical protein F5I97DRAFT_1937698 [Phlebopus sp. FC_14]
MSLTSFLLGGGSSGKKKALDKDLDAVFQAQVREDGPSSNPVVDTVTEKKKEKKRKPKQHDDEPEGKRPKSSLAETRDEPSRPRHHKKPQKGTVKKRVVVVPPEHESQRENSEDEIPERSVLDHASADSESESEDGPLKIVHEVLREDGKTSKKRISERSRKEKHAPPDETREQRDARTIFIGNLSPEIAQKRPLQKQLHRHIVALVPTAKIESTRFRSVAFQTPTSKLPSETDAIDSKKKSRQHDRDRASTWREANAGDEVSKADEKKYLTPSQKKKIAFINHDIHSSADSVHAYIVFAHPQPADTRPANLPPPPPVMDPYEAARLAVEKCNGTMFMDRMIRVDLASKPLDEVSSNTTLSSGPIGDPKLTVFVGNLDFASKEEDLRVFFEGVVSAERGPPDLDSESDKPKHWVTRVRMIRDKDTQLGKGFAYVQFADRTCVDEILALEPGKLKFAKRKLRVQRCKTMPGASAVKTTSPTKPQRTSQPSVPAIPKGDPSLGEKLAGLSKEERKQAKAVDADRLARRMAKKKARMALANKGVPVQGKDRERVRKKSAAARKHGNSAPPRKTRVRSEKSIAKRNMKK